MHWKLAAPEFKSDLFPLCRKDFKQFRSIVWIERQDRKSLVVATKIALAADGSFAHDKNQIKTHRCTVPNKLWTGYKLSIFFFNIETDFPDSITHYVVIQTKTNIHSYHFLSWFLPLLPL